MAKRKKIPTYVDYDFRTTYLQNPKTGEMQGRKAVAGRGDLTPVRRVRKKYNGYEKGMILGRNPRISVSEYERISKRGRRHSVGNHSRRKPRR